MSFRYSAGKWALKRGQDHQRMSNNGVLHRDVSAGNLLIKIRQGADKATVAPSNEKQFEGSSAAIHESLPGPRSDGEDNKIGLLIDLDHAKWVQDVFIPYTHGPPSESELSIIRKALSFNVGSDVLELAWRYFGGVAHVIGYLLALNFDAPSSVRGPDSRELTVDNLKWPRWVGTGVPEEQNPTHYIWSGRCSHFYYRF